MSAHGFKSVFMVGGIAAAALGCYLVSLRVASERAELESVENKIVLAQRDIRLLSTEIGTRGRLAQLERWNVKVIRLSAPSADQFVESSFQLATLAKPESKPAMDAPLVYASAPAPARRDPIVTNDDGTTAAPPRPQRAASDMMHVASYSKPQPKQRIEAKSAVKVPATADKKIAMPAKPAAAAKPAKTASADPLGPLSAPARKVKSEAAATGTARSTTKPAKEPGSRR
jgi:hypothetical protein